MHRNKESDSFAGCGGNSMTGSVGPVFPSDLPRRRKIGSELHCSEECQRLLSFCHNLSGTMFVQTRAEADLRLGRWEVLEEGAHFACSEEIDRRMVAESLSLPIMSTPQQHNAGDFFADEESDDDDRKLPASDTISRRMTDDPLNESPFLMSTFSVDYGDNQRMAMSPPMVATDVLKQDGIDIAAPGDDLYQHVPIKASQMFEGIPSPDVAENMQTNNPAMSHSENPAAPSAQASAHLSVEQDVSPPQAAKEAPPDVKKPSMDPDHLPVAGKPKGRRSTHRSAALSTLTAATEQELPPPPPGRRTKRLKARRRRRRPKRGGADPQLTYEPLVPTPAEQATAISPRRQEALKNWYRRLNELYEYKLRFGDCNVPQKYTKNPKLGIVCILYSMSACIEFGEIDSILSLLVCLSCAYYTCSGSISNAWKRNSWTRARNPA